MTYLRQINERHQITIPAVLLRSAGIPEHARFSLHAEKRIIVLEPQTVQGQDLSPEDWDKLNKAVQRQLKTKGFKEYSNPRQAKRHLDRLMKK